jgi:protein ImuB
MRSVPTLPLFPLQPAERHPRKRLAVPGLRPALRLPVEPVPSSRERCRQLWVAIHLPRLALEALESAPQPGRGGKSTPVVVIDAEHRQQNVLAGNAAAYAAGIRPGQSLNAAIVLVPQLEVQPRNAMRERDRLARLAAWCQLRFTPLVSLEPDNELLLEVKGSLQLFGGVRSLLQQLVSGLRGQSLTAQLALTPTPRSALWLARASPSPHPSLRSRGEGEMMKSAVIEKPAALVGQLAPVALGCLRWPEEVLAQLTSMGLRTVGDLVRLPRAGIARRLGQCWLDELDRALGRRADVRRGFRSPHRFDGRRALDHEIESTAGLSAACGPLLAGLQIFLRERQAAVAVLILELKHRAHSPTRMRIGLAAPSGDVGHLQALLEERLTAVSLPAPVIAMRLHSGALLEQVLVAGHLKIGERAGMRDLPDALTRLLERLRARLGDQAVFGVGVVEDHRPEHAWRMIEMPSSIRADGRATVGKSRSDRPLWLFAEPQWLSRKNPITCGRSPLELLSGPERIETGWWDGREVTRDYFIARNERGVRLWIYRDRCAPHGWYLHGLFG